VSGARRGKGTGREGEGQGKDVAVFPSRLTKLMPPPPRSVGEDPNRARGAAERAWSERPERRVAARLRVNISWRVGGSAAVLCLVFGV